MNDRAAPWQYAYCLHTAAVDIAFDPVKARANLSKHKVSFAHAEQALRDPIGMTVEDPDSVGEKEQYGA